MCSHSLAALFICSSDLAINNEAKSRMIIKAKEWQISARVFQHPNLFDMEFTLTSEKPIHSFEAEKKATKKKFVDCMLLFLKRNTKIKTRQSVEQTIK